jgi:hypothetical protein
LIRAIELQIPIGSDKGSKAGQSELWQKLKSKKYAKINYLHLFMWIKF